MQQQVLDMRRRIRVVHCFLFALSGVMLLNLGCAKPSVKYAKHSGSDSDGNAKFYLQSSYIVLGEKNDTLAFTSGIPYKPSSARAEAAILRGLIQKVGVLSVPAEDQKHGLYALIPQDRFGGLVITRISVTYADNTRLVRTIGSYVDDNRVKVIQALGEGISAVAKVAALGALPFPEVGGDIRLELPVVLPTTEIDDKYRPLPSQLHSGWWYRLTVANDNKDGDVETESYFSAHDVNGWFNSTDTFPMSSCKDIILTVTYRPGNEPPGGDQWAAKYAIKISDPSRLRLYKLPVAGSINAHSSCGADIATEKGSSDTAWEVVSETMKQAKAIYDAGQAKP